MRPLTLFLLFLASLVVSGCDQQTLPIRLGTNVWPGYEPLYLARELEYLDSQQVKLVELSSASDVMDAIRLGHLEAGALTLDETLTLVAEGEDLAVVMIFDISAGADVLMARENVASLSQLAGRTVAVETTAVGALMLQSALEVGRLSADDINIVHMPLTDHLQAFRAHKIDAAVTFEPFASELDRAGAHRLFDSASIEGQILDVLAVKRSLISSHRSQLEHLLNAYYKAQRDIDERPLAMLPLINKRLGMPADEIPSIMDGLILPSREVNQKMLSGHPSELDIAAQNLSQVMARQGLLKAPLFIDSLSLLLDGSETP